MNLLASGYQTEYRDSLTYTDEQVEAKDAEDPAVYNSYSYNQYYLSSSRYLDDDATNAEKAAAAEADAKSLVSDEINSVEALDAAIAALEVNADTTASSSAMDDTRYTSVNSVIAQWISDSSPGMPATRPISPTPLPPPTTTATRWRPSPATTLCITAPAVTTALPW